MKDLKDMTSSELETYKQELYIQNLENGNIKKLVQIGRELGDNLNHSYGPKFILKDGDTEIYIDDYGGYATVHVNGKLKVSTHNEKLYVPGEWEEIIHRLWPKADAIGSNKEAAIEEERKQHLLNQLT